MPLQRRAAVPETRHFDRESEPAMHSLPFFDPPPSSVPLSPDRFVSLSRRPLIRLAACARGSRRASGPGSPILIVGASRGAADDLARSVAATRPATFGIQRLSFVQLAARTALPALAAKRATASTWLGSEAVAARAAFDATKEGTLGYFGPVAATPGFPRALARTLQELRLASVGGVNLSPFGPAGPDLAWLLERFEAAFAGAASVDRSELFHIAARLLRETEIRTGLTVLLDVPIEDAAARERRSRPRSAVICRHRDRSSWRSRHHRPFSRDGRLVEERIDAPGRRSRPLAAVSVRCFGCPSRARTRWLARVLLGAG